LYNKNYDIESN